MKNLTIKEVLYLYKKVESDKTNLVDDRTRLIVKAVDKDCDNFVSEGGQYYFDDVGLSMDELREEIEDRQQLLNKLYALLDDLGYEQNTESHWA